MNRFSILVVALALVAKTQRLFGLESIKTFAYFCSLQVFLSKGAKPCNQGGSKIFLRREVG